MPLLSNTGWQVRPLLLYTRVILQVLGLDSFLSSWAPADAECALSSGTVSSGVLPVLKGYASEAIRCISYLLVHTVFNVGTVRCTLRCYGPLHPTIRGVEERWRSSSLHVLCGVWPTILTAVYGQYSLSRGVSGELALREGEHDNTCRCQNWRFLIITASLTEIIIISR